MRSPAYQAFTDPMTLTRILRINGGFDPRYAPRVALLYLLSLPLLPLAWLESALFGRRVAAVRLHPSPVVILGHDRSGTTHLLELLALDPRFSYTRPSQMVFPRSCILLDRLFDRFLAAADIRRPFDDMPVGPGSPQDDEVPLVKLTPCAEYHKYSFPRRMRRWLDRFVVRFGPGSPDFEEWKRVYLGTLRKAAFLMGRDRPLLKSPAALANLEALLALFPDARLVHIRRDPYRVIPSQLNLHRTMVERYALEDVDEAELRDLTFHQYRIYQEGFLRDRHRIPEGHLVEIRYEDLVRDRIGALRALYRELDLGELEHEDAIRRHLDAVAGYRGHRFPEDPSLRRRIREELGFAFDALGYDRDPVDSVAPAA